MSEEPGHLKPKVEDFPSIDARKLMARDFFTTGLPTLDFPGKGKNGIRVAPHPPSQILVELTIYGPSGREITHRVIDLDSTDCHLGGFRPWLKCPECGTRRIALLIDGVRVACRCCFGVAYRVQSMAPYARMERRRERIEDKLNSESGILERPYRMRWKTFERLCEEYDSLT